MKKCISFFLSAIFIFVLAIPALAVEDDMQGNIPLSGETDVYPLGDNPGEDTPDEDNPGEDTPDEDNPGEDNPDENNSGEDNLGEDDPEEEFLLEDVIHVKYINGSDGAFRPNSGVIRAEAAQMFYNLLIQAETAPGALFTDVKNQWYATPVNALAQLGIINGYGSVFKPTSNITRAEFVKILSGFYPLLTGTVTFPDIQKHWAKDYIVSAVQYGWITGYSDGTFRPNAHVTRAEAVTMINRALGRSAHKAVTEAGHGFMPFYDVIKGVWYYNDVMEACTVHTYTKTDSKETWDSYTEPLPDLAKGYHQIGSQRQLYYIKPDGRFARNETTPAGFKFNAKGQYTTGDTTLDNMLTNIILKQTKSTMKQIDQLRALYTYLTNHPFYYSPTHQPVYIAVGTTGWENQVTLQMLSNQRGNCYRYAGTFTLFARRIGYEATAVSGYIFTGARTGTGSGQWNRHGWTEIRLDGKLYICDSQQDGMYSSNRGSGDTLVFMKPYSNTKRAYKINGDVLY